ncbi:signal transducer and activator of transcription 3 [Lingula anatina]|uniref:Signal transducer and activator of transcription 3 n=1 Tax=Lingula anatina TaxID=7574 RepID=A0A1S3JZE5_LINAN|nr:signal transducer and activator of transcription 3 [Lingula anatina]|eukprot:XP_013415770.1 signal transducer and activator of transcription 3 [Lingula anatina]
MTTSHSSLKQHIMESSKPESSYVNLKKKVAAQLTSVFEWQRFCQDVQAKQDSFIGDYEKLQNSFSQDLGQYLHDKFQDILRDRKQLKSQCEAIVLQCEGQQKEIAGAIAEWLRLQQRRLIGEKLPSLDVLQNVCEEFADVLQQGKVLVDATLSLKRHCEFKETPESEPSDGSDDLILEGLAERLEDTLIQLLEKSFIMEEQPPSVLHVERGDSKKFSLSIRWLVGSKFTLALEHGMINAEFHNVTTLQASKAPGRQGKLSSKVVKGNFGVRFENMQVKGFSRLPTSSKDPVKAAEQKHFVVITGQLLLPDKRPLQLQILSQPMFLTAQSQQNPDAQAKAIWCMLGNKGPETVNPNTDRSLDKVPWSELAKVLSQLFKHGTGRGLETKHLDYLALRIFGQTKTLGSDFSSLPVSWDQFNRKPVSGTKFTFWKWFFATLNLTKDFLVDQWKKGLIEGFIDKIKAEKLLQKLPRTASGTFLLRFTNHYVDENQKANPCGGLSVVYVECVQNKMEVNHAAAITAADLKDTNLPVFLSHIQFITENADPNIPASTSKLKFLYPSLSFKQAFGEWLQGNSSSQKKLPGKGYHPLHGVHQVRIPPRDQQSRLEEELEDNDSAAGPGASLDNSHYSKGKKRFARGSSKDVPTSTPVVSVDSMSSGTLLFDRSSVVLQEQKDVSVKYQQAIADQESGEKSASPQHMVPLTTTMYTASPGPPDLQPTVGSPSSQPGESPRGGHDDVTILSPGSQSSSHKSPMSSHSHSMESPHSHMGGLIEGSHDDVAVLAPASNSSGYSSSKSPGSASSITGSPGHPAGSPLGQDDPMLLSLGSKNSGGPVRHFDSGAPMEVSSQNSSLPSCIPGSLSSAHIPAPSSVPPGYPNQHIMFLPASSSSSLIAPSTSASTQLAPEQCAMTAAGAQYMPPPYSAQLDNLLTDGSTSQGTEDGAPEDMKVLDNDTLDQLFEVINTDPEYGKVLMESENLNL